MPIDAARTDIVVCSGALRLLGAKEISDFTSSGNQPRGGVCEQLYPAFKFQIYAMHPWKFALKKVILSQAAPAPLNDWTFKYNLPGDRVENSAYALHNSDVVNAPPFRQFEMFGDHLLTDEPQLWIDYVYKVPESHWPYDFAKFMEVAFAADIAIAITSDDTLRTKFQIEAWGDPSMPENRGRYQMVKTSNVIDSPSRDYGDNSIIEARFGGINARPTGGENFVF